LTRDASRPPLDAPGAPHDPLWRETSGGSEPLGPDKYGYRDGQDAAELRRRGVLRLGARTRGVMTWVTRIVTRVWFGDRLWFAIGKRAALAPGSERFELLSSA
jgi:hypothetical protein